MAKSDKRGRPMVAIVDGKPIKMRDHTPPRLARSYHSLIISLRGLSLDQVVDLWWAANGWVDSGDP